MRQFNEKPSSVPNLGEDIKGAARHHRAFEVFARLFEAWVYQNIKERTEFMIFIDGGISIPDLDSEALEYIEKCLETLRAKGK